MPVPLQGTSANTQSAVPLCRSIKGSRLDFNKRGCALLTPARAKRRDICLSRAGSVSQARIFPLFSIVAANTSVLPPAPAQKSMTLSSACAFTNSATNWEPSSWSSNQPSRKACVADKAARFLSRTPLMANGVGSGSMSSSRNATIT